MKRKGLTSIMIVLGAIVLLTTSAWADVPAPPANQLIGITDTIFNNLTEADCRVCHDDPDNPAGTVPNVTRHHLLYDQEIPPNSAVPNPDSDGDGVDDPTYGCLNCHPEDTPENCGGVICFIVERDCLECHVQIPGDASVHHLTDAAQGNLTPGPGDCFTEGVGVCSPCHGSLVEDIGCATIPTYAPSMVTPATRDGEGAPANAYGEGAGACDYCHDQDTEPPADPIVIYNNEDTHHNTGVTIDAETGQQDTDRCAWCHGQVFTLNIRICEECHSFKTLHNIQADSPNSGNIGTIVVGGEDAGWGHIGRDMGAGDSDCWGCHGFDTQVQSAPGAGPLTPFINSSDIKVMTAGTDTVVTLVGVAFTNQVGTFEWNSTVLLTSSDSMTELSPDSISQESLTVTIPGTMPAGNYLMQATKGNLAISNPVALSIKPEVVIDTVACSDGTLTITGSGFGDGQPAGAEEYINAQVGGTRAEIISWTNTEIVAAVPFCSDAVTVNALFGSPTTCDCEGNFDGDEDTDGADIHTFKMDFGRNPLQIPCEDGATCSGDFDCDEDVDGSDAFKMKEDFGRSPLRNPCAPISVEQWCAY